MTPSIKQTVLTDPLYAAIRLLTEEADSLRECHTRTPDDWTGEPEAKAQYDHILEVVALLSKLRAEGVQAGGYTPTHDQPHQTGVGEWCAPGPAADQRRAWLLRFADVDRGDCVYYDEQEARGAFARSEARGWNCYLFEYARRAALASAPVAGEAQKPMVWLLETTPDGYALHRSFDFNEPPRGFPGLVRKTPLYAAPQASQAVRILFPTHLRKMWSGGEVQAWLDNHQGITPPTASAKGSLERYRDWRAEQAEADKDGVRSEGHQ